MEGELKKGDCWIGLSIAIETGLIIASIIGKHTDKMIEGLVNNTEGKTACKNWKTDDWGGYERVLSEEINHEIGKENTQRLERINGIVRQQTGRWHRRQNKFAKEWEETERISKLVISYYNWIWENSRLGTKAAERAELTDKKWDWHDLATYPTIF